MMKLLCFAMFACAYNLLLGFSGMLSFGHAAFFGCAAYVTGWLATAHGWGTVPAILAGVAVAMLLGLLIGALAIRRRGIYFAMITLALAQLLYFVCLEAPFTGGENGLQGVPRGTLSGLRAAAVRPGRCTTWCSAAFVGVFLFIRRVVHSPFGQVLKAIRENEPRAISLGYDVQSLQAAGVRAVGHAGRACRLAQDPGARLRHPVGCLRRPTSGEVILMTLLGGTGTFFGPVIGARSSWSRCRSTCPTSSAAG